MSDQKLRDLERRWLETGTVEDEAAYLLERVRAGSLSRESLELAAYCGHAAAQTAAAVADAPAAFPKLRPFLASLIRFGRAGMMGVVAGLVRVCALIDADPEREDLRAVMHWLRCPCPEHLADVERLLSLTAPTIDALPPVSPMCLSLAVLAARNTRRRFIDRAAAAATLASQRTGDQPRRSVDVLTELRRGAASWALGTPDYSG